MWVLPDCPGWTCPARFLRGQKLTSDLCPSVPALRPSVLFLLLLAPLQPVLVPFSSQPGLLPFLAEVLSSLPALLPSVASLLPSLPASWGRRRRVRPRVFYPSGRQPSPAATRAATRAASLPSWLLLSVPAVAKVGNPFDDLGVVRHELAVGFVMLQRARVIPEI